MEKLQNLFTDFIMAKTLFLNRDVLTNSFAPENIPHREKQILELGKVLAPALVGAKPSNVFIYGRCGTGKSLVSLYVAKELEKTAKNNGSKVRTVYLNCKMKGSADTEYRLLATIIKEFGKQVPFTGLPIERVYNIFFDTIDSEPQTIILIIDEIDALVEKTGDEILYNLTRINSELKKAKISIIGITNNLSFAEGLDPRVKSSLSEEEMVFPPYNALQIKDILEQRALLAFSPGALEQGVIEKCAALAAQEHGDARRALDLLRVAGETAERQGCQKATAEHVDAAEEKIDTDKYLETIKIQPKQSQLVLYTILEIGEKKDSGNAVAPREIQTGEILNMYQEMCTKHGLKKLTPRRVSDLIAELDLFGIIEAKVVSKGRYGRTRKVFVALPETTIKKIKKFLDEVFY